MALNELEAAEVLLLVETVELQAEEAHSKVVEVLKMMVVMELQEVWAY